MAVERLLLCVFSLFFITLFGSLYFGITHNVRSRSLQDQTLKHRYGNSTGLYLKTSENVTVRVSSKLQLNCTVVGTEYALKPQLSWYYGGKMLNNITRTLNNTTIQLTIASVDWMDRGTYICKQIQAKSVLPSGVFVEVGDIPGPPQDVWVNNVNFKTYIHWTRPRVTGGLPISYSVNAQCKNASLDDQECALKTIYHTDYFGDQPRSKEFTCQVKGVLRADLVYTAFIVAENSLGSSQSCMVDFKLNLMNPLATTPLPPKTVLAKKKMHGMVTLTWQDEKPWRPVAVEYLILYHKDGEKLNKSETVMSPKRFAVIEGLAPNVHYHFYLMTRFRTKVNNRTLYSTYSDTKELSLITDPAAPSQPPVINCSSVKSTVDSLERRNVTISFELPQTQTLNGRLKNFQVSYACQRGSQQTFGNLTITNTSERRAVLTGLQLTHTCRVWMNMCSYKGGCSTNSNMCVIGSQDLHGPSSALNRSNKDLKLALNIATGVLGGVLLVVTIALCRSRRQQNRRGRIALSSLHLPTVVHGYDEIEVPLVSNSPYDMLNLQPTDDVVLLTGRIELSS